MAYLLFILATIILFAGFLLLTAQEQKRGVRFLNAQRMRFDRTTARFEFIATHVDFAAFIRDSVKSIGERVAHDIAHRTLLIVRFVERLLTRAVRILRERRADQLIAADTEPAPTQDGPSSFAKTIKEFKTTLRSDSEEK